MPGMSPRMKANKGRFGADGLDPKIVITSPANGFTIAVGSMPFAATAILTDEETGSPATSVAWTSDVDVITNAGLSTNITLTTVGTHVLTATATDPSANTGSYSITVIVTA